MEQWYKYNKYCTLISTVYIHFIYKWHHIKYLDNSVIHINKYDIRPFTRNQLKNFKSKTSNSACITCARVLQCVCVHVCVCIRCIYVEIHVHKLVAVSMLFKNAFPGVNSMSYFFFYLSSSKIIYVFVLKVQVYYTLALKIDWILKIFVSEGFYWNLSLYLSQGWTWKIYARKKIANFIWKS